jgi:hypothetical protein
MPLQRTKTMPVGRARCETRGRPPFGRRGGIGKKGSTRCPHVTPTEAIDTVLADPDDNRVLECAVGAGSQTTRLDGDVLGTNPKYDWKRFGDSISTPGQISSAAFV